MTTIQISAELKGSAVTEVPAGSTAVLKCNSNDNNHNWTFWLGKDRVIGPENAFDERKYKYEVLSGKLHIDNVSPTESWYYKCISRKYDGSAISVGEVEMNVTRSSFGAIDAVKLVAIVVSIIVIVGCAAMYFRLTKDWNKYDGRALVPGISYKDCYYWPSTGIWVKLSQ